ncbi:MAG: CPBP family intramembrane glutamic endopeptidase [Balneolaceae bacterium]
MMDSESSENEDVDIGKSLSGQKLMGLSLISFTLYTLTALTLYYFFFDESLLSAFKHGYSISIQVLYGFFAGCSAAGVIIFFSTRPPMGPVLEDFAIFKVLKNSNFTAFDRVQLSLFAGVGEEILFRGAMQPLIGIWLTSIIFVAIHGYFKFKSAGHILFGILLFGLSMMLGFLYEYAGLISAMIAHAIYDIILLWWVASRKS